MLICVMLMTTLLAVAKPPQKIESKSSTETMSAAYDADVPVWEIGDKWTYKIDNISILYQQEDKLIHLYLSIAELPLTVINTTGDVYTLEFQTSLSGKCTVNANSDNGPVNLTITFLNLPISGNVLIEKSTLGIKEVSAVFVKGKFLVDIINQPFITLPRFLQKISARITMNVTTTFDTPFSLLTFPLSTGIFWNLNSTNFTMNGKIQSNLLTLLNFLNNIAKQFGYEFLPEKFSALLPSIDIKEALIALGTDNVFKIPAIPFAFICYNTEDITIPAGTYEAYTILIAGKAQCYYAPIVGNVIKITGNFEEIIPYITNINMELLYTNYS